MINKRLLIWVTALAMVAVVVYQQTMDSRAPVSSSESNEVPIRSEPSSTSTPGRASADEERAGQSSEDSADPDNCLTQELLESHPMLVDDSYRFDAVVTSGPTMGAYRGLSSPELRNLAIQGDSAAMAVLGAMAVMRSLEEPEEKAVAYLMLEDTELLTFRFKRPLDPEVAAHVEEAGEWFYKAALHGRVMALYLVGDMLWRRKGGAVELGWIKKDEYEALSSYQKTALNPSNLYNVLALEIAPELGSGPYGNFISEMMPQTERQQRILDGLRDQFHRDLKSANLPPISVPESAVPPIEELTKMLCQSELDRLRDAATE